MTVAVNMKMANGKSFFQTEDGVTQSAAKWTELHMQIINASPALVEKYEAAAAANTPYIISKKNGIFFDSNPEKSGMYVSQNYFQTGAPEVVFANSLYIAVEGGHEAQHAEDSRNPSIGLPQIENYKNPGDYSMARGVIEGRAVAFEALVDAQLQGKKFSVNGKNLTVDPISFSVGGDSSLDYLLAEIYANSNFTDAQKFERAALGARDSYLEKMPSTGAGGISYFEQNMRAFAEAWSGLKGGEISNVAQDDNGYWTVTASNQDRSITRNYDPRTIAGSGAPGPRLNSETVTSNLDGGATLMSSINHDTKKEVIQVFDADDNLIRRTEIVPVGTGGRISTISTYLPGTSQPDQVTVQQVDANGAVVAVPLVNGTEVNAVSLSTITTAPAPSRTPTPDGTSLGPSATNNNLVSLAAIALALPRISGTSTLPPAIRQ
ncbi:hypothetical protein M2282_004083 [Variovorax boronicumulans]|uniref:hypothetical protein n=1 Tax=Variovorax boronicumulans TaxID=436515 RepID=UPI0024768B49|nr:hypothetical protein [Variovorax boronicumulans]MDH6168919.1 hypothetical protein [Variovorax boronicumulans]